MNGIIDSMDMSLNKLQEMVKDKDIWCAAAYGVTKSQPRLSDWTTTRAKISYSFILLHFKMSTCGHDRVTTT